MLSADSPNTLGYCNLAIASICRRYTGYIGTCVATWLPPSLQHRLQPILAQTIIGTYPGSTIRVDSALDVTVSTRIHTLTPSAPCKGVRAKPGKCRTGMRSDWAVLMLHCVILPSSSSRVSILSNKLVPPSPPLP